MMPDKKTHSTGYLLLSGGQDSFAAGLWAKERFKKIYALSMIYEQKHIKELDYAKTAANYLNADHQMIDIGSFISAVSESGLLSQKHTNDLMIEKKKHPANHALPISFVPNRNGIFLTCASSAAYKNHDNPIHLIIGACETDYSGYPDCRAEYLKAKERELSLGLDTIVKIHAPLMAMTKGDVFSYARKHNALDFMIDGTLTCYNGVETLHKWGRGCEKCPSCKLRKRGFENFIQAMETKPS